MKDLREKIAEKTGCGYMRCTDFKNGVCYYKYPHCKYRPEDDLFPSLEGSIHCSKCGSCVSSPVPKDTVIRAWIECPECIEKDSEPFSLEGIEVEEVCSCDDGKLIFKDDEGETVSIDHERCHGTGKTYRHALKEDIDGTITATGRLVLRDEKLNRD